MDLHMNGARRLGGDGREEEEHMMIGLDVMDHNSSWEPGFPQI